MTLIDWLRDWGWLVGVVYLGFLVVRESGRPGAADRVKAARNVEAALLQVIFKWEELVKSYVRAINGNKNEPFGEYYFRLSETTNILLVQLISLTSGDAQKELVEIVRGIDYTLRHYHQEYDLSIERVQAWKKELEKMALIKPSEGPAPTRPSE